MSRTTQKQPSAGESREKHGAWAEESAGSPEKQGSRGSQKAGGSCLAGDRDCACALVTFARTCVEVDCGH